MICYLPIVFNSISDILTWFNSYHFDPCVPFLSSSNSIGWYALVFLIYLFRRTRVVYLLPTVACLHNSCERILGLFLFCWVHDLIFITCCRFVYSILIWLWQFSVMCDRLSNLIFKKGNRCLLDELLNISLKNTIRK